MANSDPYILPKGESPEGRGGGGSEIRFNWSKNSGGLKGKRGGRGGRKSPRSKMLSLHKTRIFLCHRRLFFLPIHLRASEAIAVLHGNKFLLPITLIL